MDTNPINQKTPPLLLFGLFSIGLVAGVILTVVITSNNSENYSINGLTGEALKSKPKPVSAIPPGTQRLHDNGSSLTRLHLTDTTEYVTWSTHYENSEWSLLIDDGTVGGKQMIIPAGSTTN